MASETFFNDGDRVKFANGWWSRRKHEVALMKLRGVVIGCDDTGRECCYYGVKWDATPEELEDIGVNPHEYWQSDALRRARK